MITLSLSHLTIYISIIMLLLIIIIYIAVIQRKKANKYKDLYNVLFDKNEALESSVEAILINMKQIDDTGVFESDDEVGAVFGALKNILNNQFKNNILISENEYDDRSK